MSNIALAAAVLIVGVLVGYNVRGERDAAIVSAAGDRERACKSELDGKATAVDDLRREVATQRERHEKALAATQATLAARERENTVLRDAAQTSINAIRTAAHDDASCAPLARLPVCSAVARQLWPAAVEAAAAEHSAH